MASRAREFAAELANPATGPEEQIVALKFLLHFVGDLHQPLHASDDNDRGGNDKPVSAARFKPGNLHHFRDTAFVGRLGPNAGTIAANLLGHLSEDAAQAWSRGVPSDWALETFRMGRDDAYGQLPSQMHAVASGFPMPTSPWRHATSPPNSARPVCGLPLC
jgi:hypothetical protein